MSDRKPTTLLLYTFSRTSGAATLPNLYPGSPRLRFRRLCSGQENRMPGNIFANASHLCPWSLLPPSDKSG
jgi:hypothetical protein